MRDNIYHQYGCDNGPKEQALGSSTTCSITNLGRSIQYSVFRVIMEEVSSEGEPSTHHQSYSEESPVQNPEPYPVESTSVDTHSSCRRSSAFSSIGSLDYYGHQISASDFYRHVQVDITTRLISYFSPVAIHVSFAIHG